MTSARPTPAARADLEPVVYSPTSPLSEPTRLVAAMFHDLVASRGLAWRLFLRDTAALYRQSVLGYVWAFLPPLATSATFVFLNSQHVISVGNTPVPYAAYVMISTLLWQGFVDALNSPLKALNANKSLLMKINFPREALIVSGLLEVMFNFCVRLVLLVPIMAFFHLAVGPSLLLFPLALAALVLLGLSIGLLLTPVALLYTDIGRALSIVTTFWLFLTPVVYPPAKSGLASLLAQFNPVSPVLSTARDWLLAQPAPHVAGLALVSLGAAFALMLGWLMIRLALPHLIERMGS